MKKKKMRKRIKKNRLLHPSSWIRPVDRPPRGLVLGEPFAGKPRITRIKSLLRDRCCGIVASKGRVEPWPRSESAREKRHLLTCVLSSREFFLSLSLSPFLDFCLKYVLFFSTPAWLLSPLHILFVHVFCCRVD